MNPQRVVVVMIDTPAGMRYISDVEYRTAAADTPANTSFEARLIGDVTWSREMTIVLWGPGRSTGGVGAITILNSDGKFDDLRGGALRGRRFWVYEVEQGAAWSTRTLEFSAVVDRGEPQGYDQFQLMSADLLARLEVPASAVYEAADDVPDQLIGRPRPLAIGHPFSCPVVLVDEVDYIFDCHAAPEWYGVNVVRDQGFPITLGSGYRRAIAAGRYGIEKLARAFGRVVCDVRGATVQIAEIVGETPGNFTGGLTGWTSASTGSGSLAAIGGVLTFGRLSFGTGTAYITLGSLIVGQAYLFRIDVTAASAGSIELFCGSVVAQFNAPGSYTVAFVAASTSWQLRLTGSSGSVTVTVDNARLRQVRVIRRLTDIVRYLAVTIGPLEESDVDWTSVQALDDACPWQCSAWIDGVQTLRQALDQVLDSFCASMYEDRLGRLAVGQLRRPEGAADFVITEWMLADGSIPRLTPDLAPGLSRTVAGARNWYRYAPGELADDASLDPLIPVLTADYRERRTATASVHPGLGPRVGNIVPPRSDVAGSAAVASGGGRPASDVGIGTLLDNGDDLQDLADHIGALYPGDGELPEFLEIQALGRELKQIDPFDQGDIQLDRFAEGRRGVVKRIQVTAGQDAANLHVWMADLVLEKK